MNNNEFQLLEDGSSAIFSPDRKYRYVLIRQWNFMKPFVSFIGLNPSTADEINNDPTVRRCMNFARDWGYGGIYMLNIFAFRATDPKVMKKEAQPSGSPENDDAISLYTQNSNLIIAAWGTHGAWMHRGKEVKNLLKTQNIQLHSLGLTKEGYPKHPLYLKSDLKPQRWI